MPKFQIEYYCQFAYKLRDTLTCFESILTDVSAKTRPLFTHSSDEVVTYNLICLKSPSPTPSLIDMCSSILIFISGFGSLIIYGSGPEPFLPHGPV